VRAAPARIDSRLPSAASDIYPLPMPIVLKYLISAALVVLISEVAKRSDKAGALIGALPWVTTLAMCWLYFEKQGGGKIANHAWYTFWYVLPTLPMFLLIPLLLRKGWSFPPVMLLSALLTMACFALTVMICRKFGIELI